MVTVPSGATVVTLVPDFRDNVTTTRFAVVASAGAGAAVLATGGGDGAAGATGCDDSAPHAAANQRTGKRLFRMRAS
jgi:hypothetical protein